MKSISISFYFVLYIVAMITVFVITMERDQLLHDRDEDIAHLVELYVKPLHLSPYTDTARFFIDPGQNLTGGPVTIRIKADGPVDKHDITFSLVDGRQQTGNRRPEHKTGSAEITNENGDGVLVLPPLEAGIYEFLVAGSTSRIVYDGDKMNVRIRDTMYAVPYSERLERVDRDTTLLIAKILKSGIEPPQLTLGVQETQENWVVGPSFRKKIFVGGVENLETVTFESAAGIHIERSTDAASFVTAVWQNPTLGQRTFTVTANAHRGLGAKDRATTRFGVHVLPAAFASAPSPKGFWGIPYVFDGQITGLNPIDLSVEVAHDGQFIHTVPAVPKDTLLPDRRWNILLFKVLYRGVAIREHRVALTTPPPPQIRWVQQTLDRANDTFLISAASTDPVGGPVRVSLESQPAGIAQVDRIRGTTFNIRIKLDGKPTAVFLKLTATDQYGGQSVSAKQFNIPQ